MAAQESKLYLSSEDRPNLAPEEILSIVIVVNGGIEMSQGKIASQCFQACLALLDGASESPHLKEQLKLWQAQGWRTIVRVAETPGLFQRVLDECDGVVLRDEGLTEVEDGTATVFTSFPHRRGDTPKILTHKRVPLL
jgi:peptidyl-tRNA hydrolase